MARFQYGGTRWVGPHAAGRHKIVTWWRRPYVWALASALAVLVANVGGIAIGDDGVGYQAIADSLESGNGLGYFLERHLTIWPPGWPALMALVAKLTPLDTVGAAVLLNAVTAFAIVMLVNRLLVRLVPDDLLILLGTAVAALGASSMVFGHLLMTDFSFVAVTLAMMLALMNHRDTGSVRWLLIAALLVGAGFMIRYAGIVNIGTAGLWLLVDRRTPIATRVRNGALFGVVAAAGPVAWMVRNLSIDDTALGVRYSSNRGLIPNVFDAFATIGNFLIPGVAIETRTIWAAVALAGCTVMAAMLWRVLRRDERVRSATGLVDLAATATGLLVLHVGVYGAYMLFARTTTGLNRLDFRLLNPIYLPLAIVALAILGRVRSAGADEAAPTGSRAPLWRSAAGSTAMAWAGLNVVIGLGMIGYFATSPDLFVGNYERPAFDAARASTALDALPGGCELSSNLPNALYDASVESQWSPRETGLESNDPVDDLAKLQADLERGGGEHCLIWIDLEPTYGHLATLGELQEQFTLIELASDNEVTTYRFEPR